jgi:hypothetical protein
VSRFVLFGAANDQIFWPVHEFGSEAVAAASQLGANVRSLSHLQIKKKRSKNKKIDENSIGILFFRLISSLGIWLFFLPCFWSDKSQLV